MQFSPIPAADAPHSAALPASDSPCLNLPPQQLQVALRHLEAQLLAAQRLAVAGTLAATAAHEINNHLTSVLGSIDLVLRAGNSVDARKSLERVQSQTLRIQAISEQLQKLARPQADPQASCTVAQAVRESVAAAIRPFEKDGIRLQITVPEDIRVRVSLNPLVQVLLNLLLNARKAMENLHGKLVISARPDGQSVIIDVRDSGKGIPPDRLEQVMKPFFAAADPYDPLAWQTVGLGLYVCRLIARTHGATIEAFANEGPGCTFRLRWPASDRAN